MINYLGAYQPFTREMITEIYSLLIYYCSFTLIVDRYSAIHKFRLAKEYQKFMTLQDKLTVPL